MLVFSHVSLQTSLYNSDTFQDLETVKLTQHVSPDLLKGVCSPDRCQQSLTRLQNAFGLCQALKAVPVSHVSDGEPKQVIIANRELSSDTSESPETKMEERRRP